MTTRSGPDDAGRLRVARVVTALIAVFFTLAAAGASSDSALAVGWSMQSTPNPAVTSTLSGVSCAAAAACAAVGNYVHSDGSQVTLAEQRNGSAWTIPPTPTPAGLFYSTLYGVSCTAATACTTVGYGVENNTENDVPLAGRWNGSGWAIQTVTAPAYSVLSGVSCATANSCTAVGESDISSTSGLTLAEAWNGSSWVTQATPSPSGATISALSAVSCTATACIAVGHYMDSSGAQITLAEQWNGTSWAIQSTPNPTGATSSTLSGVSCAAVNACTAVGYYVDSSGAQATLAEQWNGSAWAIQSTPNPTGATSSILSSVSCSAAAACIAVGSSGQATLAEQWNGTTWTIKPTSSPSGATSSVLSGVSCTAAVCTAVGDYVNSSGNRVTLAEQWDGTTWTTQATPNPPGSGILSGVSCAATTACSAVGYSSPEAALAEQWNGTAWAIQPSLSTGTAAFSPDLAGVSCTSGAACTAVGSVEHVYCYPRPPYCKVVTGTLAMRWNGTTWSRASTPNPSPTSPSVLSGVTCPGATTCTAVGNSGGVTLAEAWNGTVWSIQTTPGGGGLSSVSCTASTSCVAVGHSGGGTLAEAWNGTAWTIEPTPNPTGAASSVLSGVSCAATVCTAVGNYVNGSGNQMTLAEQWNGSAWTIQSTPNPTGATSSRLSGVSCTAANGCTAVGDYVNSLGTDVTLAERYSG